ncbi:M81 family metallopeptidase [Mesorhizobium sp. M0768]
MPSLGPTTGGRGIVETLHRLETDAGILDATFIHGFSYAENDHSGASLLRIVIAANATAECAARELSDWIWEMRAAFGGAPLAAKEGLALARSHLTHKAMPIGWASSLKSYSGW